MITEGRDRLTEEIRRLHLCLRDRTAAADHIAVAMYRQQIRHLERARAVAFDAAALTPEPPGDHRSFVDDDEPPLDGYAERADDCG